jgi:hypothetical protein
MKKIIIHLKTPANSPPAIRITSHNRCQQSDCTKQPSFGPQGTQIAQLCTEHKPEEYVTVISKRCQHSGCNKRPNFGLPGTQIAQFCAEHKPEEYVNVISKLCQYPGCTKQPTFGPP